MRTPKSQETIEADTELLWNKIANHDNFFATCEKLEISLSDMVATLEIFAQLFTYTTIQKAIDTFETKPIGTLRLMDKLVYERKTKWE